MVVDCVGMNQKKDKHKDIRTYTYNLYKSCQIYRSIDESRTNAY